LVIFRNSPVSVSTLIDIEFTIFDALRRH